ncbi:SHD1 domain-containing protein [Pontiella agarivorans]|uniref:SHD1 domain-containing protein n=1 Tax=Pontiella agarivorans TaxID=3038953 RepID=A0ABU5N0N8_9BACT|nr:SHD1 domain-containing protein [Pontiella agarivorans]MDZ8119998.1 SHD1 domain-containing protein [Pontiella agarivorans]
MKTKVKGRRNINKGGASGFVISISIHAAAFMLAGMLVVFNVTKKEEKKFVPPKPVDRPKMKLKKPRVKMKKSARPKSMRRIVTKVQKANMPEVQLPEMNIMGNGFDGDIGGFDIVSDISEMSVFGSEQSIGNDLEGVVYSLLHDRNGGTISMGPDQFRDILRKYILSGWKGSVLSKYYQSPKKIYSTHVMVPPVPTAIAPGIFGVQELEDYFLFIKYEGKLVHKEDIKFRFWGIGDAYIFVNVDGKEVLMSALAIHHSWFDWWSSTVGGDRTYVLGNQRMVIGDWIELKAGEPVDMKVLFGEWKGGEVAGMLLVEVEGEEYPISRSGGPLLPAFKMEEFSWDQLTEISKFLAEGECSLTNGPVFNDYYTAKISTPEPVAFGDAEPAVEEDIEPEPSTMRIWTTEKGRTIEAEYLSAVSGKVILKTIRGKQVKIPLGALAQDDREFVLLSNPPKLNINFSKSTKVRKFGDTYTGDAPPVRGSFYTFSASVEQISMRPYGLELTAEFYAIGEEVGGEKHILLDHTTSSFTLTRENNFIHEFSGREVEMLDYIISDERRGQRYGGYLVVIRDKRSEIIAYESSSENFFRNLDKFKNLQNGWYFDKDINRCLPTPPEARSDLREN